MWVTGFKKALLTKFKRSFEQPSDETNSDSELIKTLKDLLDEEQLALRQIDEDKTGQKIAVLNETRDQVELMVSLN